jgi:hypothetical protein
MTTQIGLAEYIYQVKRELMQPEEGVVDPVPLLAIEEVELDIAVTVSIEAKAGLKVYVVELGGGGDRSDAHSVHVKLAPLLSPEERMSKLSQDPRWAEIVTQQMEYTLKGRSAEPLKDQY